MFGVDGSRWAFISPWSALGAGAPAPAAHRHRHAARRDCLASGSLAVWQSGSLASGIWHAPASSCIMHHASWTISVKQCAACALQALGAAAPYTTGTWTLGAGGRTLEEEARGNAQTGVTILNTPSAARSRYSAHSGHLGGPFLVQGWDRDCTPPQAIQFGSTREEARRVVRQPSWRTTRRSLTPSGSLIIETRAAGKKQLDSSRP